MAAPKRTTAQRGNDLQLIADLYLKQWTQADIAAHIADIRKPLGYTVTQQTVSNDLKAIQKDWRESSLIDMNEAKQRELERIDVLEREYWVAWAKSKEPKMSSSKRVSGGKSILASYVEGSPEFTPDSLMTGGRPGDPRYLEGVRWCIAQRCKILGVEAPMKVAVEDWRSQAIEDIKAGALRYRDLAEAFSPDLATELFRRAGVPVRVEVISEGNE